MQTFAFLDESTAKHIVTTGLVAVPEVALADAYLKIGQSKARFGLPRDASIHCRILFHADARRKSPFSNFSAENLDDLLMDCIIQLRTLGSTFWVAWVDRSKYPPTLRLFEGQEFRVTDKHLAGILSMAVTRALQDKMGTAPKLIYDPDRTKIDWGLARKMQASHFARITNHAQPSDQTTRPLVDIADVVAYSASHALLSPHEPHNRKLRRFVQYARIISPTLSHLSWGVPPVLSPSQDTR